MKKLFLSSSFSDIAKLLPDFVGESLIGKTVTFIPTAANVEKMNFYVKSGKKALEKLGLLVDELDIFVSKKEEIEEKLKKNDYIYVSGGNTFFLLQELQKQKVLNFLVEQIEKGKLYIGESAGSMIVAPNIEYVQGMDSVKAAPELQGFDALGVVDFYPIPHHTNFPFKKAVEKMIEKYDCQLNLKVISNAQVILVNGDEIQIVAKA